MPVMQDTKIHQIRIKVRSTQWKRSNTGRSEISNPGAQPSSVSAASYGPAGSAAAACIHAWLPSGFGGAQADTGKAASWMACITNSLGTRDSTVGCECSG